MKKHKKRDYFYLFLVEFFVSGYLTFLIIIFQQESTFRSVMDGFMVTGVVVVLFGWIIFLSNVGLYELFEFVILFIISVIKKESMSKSYYEMVYLREKGDSIAHRTILFTGFLYLIAGSVLYYMYYNGLRF